MPSGNPGVYAYHPDGTPFLKNGTNRFGNQGVFDSDEEGLLLYTFPNNGKDDNGAGFYLVADQRSDRTDFEFFDRETWSHLGTLQITGVANTDGIGFDQPVVEQIPASADGLPAPRPGWTYRTFRSTRADTYPASGFIRLRIGTTPERPRKGLGL